MRKVSNFFKNLPKDKLLHIVIGTLIFVFCLWKLPIGNANFLFLVSWVFTAFAGAFKEIVIDKWAKLGTPEWNDFYATIAIPTFITALQFLISL